MDGGEALLRWLLIPATIVLVVHGSRDLFVDVWRSARRILPRLPLERAPSPGTPPPRLGDLLQRRHALQPTELERALELQRQSGHPLGVVLEYIGAVTAAQVDEALAEQRSLPVATVDPEAIPIELLSALPEHEAETWRALPLQRRRERVVVACSRPDPIAERALEARLGHPVELAFLGEQRLQRARCMAYRRLCSGRRTGIARLGERLLSAGLLNEEELTRALEEQARTGEHLADLLVRRRLVTEVDIAAVARGPLSRGFVELTPEKVDLFGLRRLGYAACAFHDALPLWGEGETRTLASSHPIHPTTIRAFEERLGVELRATLTPAVPLRAARSAAARRAWPRGIHQGALHPDAAELAALRIVLRRRHLALRRIERETGWTARAPIELALERGILAKEEASALYADTYLIEAGPMPTQGSRGWLPPELERLGDLVVAAGGPEGLEVVTRRPRPDRARAVRAVHADAPIRWRVAVDAKDGARRPPGASHR